MKEADFIDKYQVLKKVFGHDTFRPGQEELIDALIAGRDVLGTMPTGAGKSMCYQIPAIVSEGVTIVVSPLISLMTDQVNSLIGAGISAAYLNSTLTPAQIEIATTRALQGRYKLIYVAPERLGTYALRQIAASGMVSMVAVDEAHCVSQWGQDFRPDYLKISDFVRSMPTRPPVGAFTATATDVVRRDICKFLELQHPLSVATGFDRPNLYFDVLEPEDKYEALLKLLGHHLGETGIIYCSTRKEVDSLNDKLAEDGFLCAKYHAGLSDEERSIAQDNFQSGRVNIIIATNAFGMGIDKGDVRFVIHYNMPRSMEAYYQEAGRAGRDGKDSECIMLYGKSDIMTAKFLINHNSGKAEMTVEQERKLKRRDMDRLQAMIGYSTGTGCYRSAILDYFGEKNTGKCCMCGKCRSRGYKAEVLLQSATGKKACKSRKPGKVAMTTVIQPHKGKSTGKQVTASMDRQSKTENRQDAAKLVEALKRYRTDKAKELGVAPYMVYSDQVMNDIAIAQPHNLDELMEVRGIASRKANQFGDDILKVIASWRISSSEPVPAPQAVMDKIDSQASYHNQENWTEEEIAILRRAYLSGMTLDTLCVIHGRDAESIIEKLREMALIR